MISIFKPLIYEPAKHVYKLIFQEKYRRYCILESKLSKRPRYTECKVTVNDWELHLPDSASFLSAYKEIFLREIYAFKSSHEAPSILDLGANIGLSVLFFKHLYPQSEITAFEADPAIFEFLEKNIYGNGFNDVKLLNKAIWYRNETIKFSVERADGGRIAQNKDENHVQVQAIDLNEYLAEHHVDFLKMDIEGAEGPVLSACEKSLSKIRWIFVEYHSQVDEKQYLDQIIRILSQQGFRIHIHSEFYTDSPFISRKTRSNFDLQLNIFAWRDDI